MKKLLSILLTVVMAVCLMNLNSSYAKASGPLEDCETTSGTCVIDESIEFDGTKLYYSTSTDVTPRTDMIEYVDGTITIKQNIKTDTAYTAIFKSFADANLTINKDISLTGTMEAIKSTNNLTINGNEYTLTCETSESVNPFKAVDAYDLTLNNVNFVANSNNRSYAIYVNNKVFLNASTIKASNPNANASGAMTVWSDEPVGVVTKFGTTDGSTTSLKELTFKSETYNVNVGTEATPDYKVAKYVELNTEPSYEYRDSGWVETSTKSLYSDNDKIFIKNSSSSNVTFAENQNDVPAPKSPIEPNGQRIYGFYADGGVVTLRDKKINITNEAPISCKGLYFKDTGWYNDTTQITNLSLYGISYDSTTNTATFSKSLTTSELNATISIQAPLNIIIANDISITNNNTGVIYSQQAIYIISNDVKIDGQGHKVVLNVDSTRALFTSKEITLKDIELVAENNSAGSPTILSLNNIKLEGDVKLEATNSNAGGAVVFNPGYDFVFSGTAVKKGSATQKGQKEDSVHAITGTTNTGKYAVGSDDDVLAKYVRITNTPIDTPTTTSEPTVKDESCEKVIGPTWHWNNTKGVCEEYTLVRTNTR